MTIAVIIVAVLVSAALLLVCGSYYSKYLHTMHVQRHRTWARQRVAQRSSAHNGTTPPPKSFTQTHLESLRAWKKPELPLDPELGHGSRPYSEGEIPTLKSPPKAKVSEKNKTKSPVKHLETLKILEGSFTATSLRAVVLLRSILGSKNQVIMRGRLGSTAL
ncbi:hypothetical protein DM02DRAFT_627220 [Periconia macrospinosa]|uniref:Uncharacterized protein n=1 Tax=Periconia macrospinosa TaxID=97972 RepID=A0A2V1DYE4_9PLEO|nr:hypothetical protein DM02DRAFT_627220 [Periconia macrospinosa]